MSGYVQSDTVVAPRSVGIMLYVVTCMGVLGLASVLEAVSAGAGASVCCCTPPGSMPGGGGCRRRRWAPICFKQVDHPLAVADHELVVAPRVQWI